MNQCGHAMCHNNLHSYGINTTVDLPYLSLRPKYLGVEGYASARKDGKDPKRRDKNTSSG